jgi:transcriptional regulator with XRE-family HTH domain
MNFRTHCKPHAHLIRCGDLAAEIPVIVACPAYLQRMTDLTSTARRRELGAELRRIRQQHGYNGMDMAERLDWTPSMLSRAETGKRLMSQLEVATYTAMCGVGGKRLDELLGLADEPDDYRLKSHAGQIPDELKTLIFHETTATEIASFQSTFIPGVMQTEDYARALFREGGLEEPVRIEECVRIRMIRRDILTKINPPQCTFHVHENALRAPVGGPQVMSEQMLQMLFLGTRPQCSIRVIPVSAGARGMSAGSFQIFGYPEGPSVVSLQHETTSEFLEDRKDLLGYRTVLKRLASVALDDAQSREFISRMASDYERQGAAEHADSPAGMAKEQL